MSDVGWLVKPKNDPYGFPQIPEPRADIESLLRTVKALKQAVDLLTGASGNGVMKAMLEGVVPTMPLRIPQYQTTNMPDAWNHNGSLIYIANATAPRRLWYSNGIAWINVSDGSSGPP